MRLKKETIVLISILVATFFVFTGICILIKLNDLPQIDVAWRDFAYQIRGDKGGFMYWVARIFTEFGYIYIMAAVILLLVFYTGIDNRFWLFLFVLALSRVFNVIFKDIYDRVRPLEEMRWQVETSSSFPSGHSTNVAVIFSFLFFIFYKSKHKRWIKNTGMIFCALIIPIVMFSRNILGVHYLTDVIAGASCGIFSATIGMLLLNLFNERNILTKPLIKFKWLASKDNKEEAVVE